MMRPREAFDQRLLSARLDFDPEPLELRWLHDVFGNSVALASFGRRTSHLLVTSEATLEHAPLSQAQIDVEPYARLFPFTYSSEDMPDLLRSIERHHLDPERVIDNWARAHVANDGNTDTLALLSNMAKGIKRDFTYVPRHEKGTQSPIETLRKRQGTCRDFAVLMIEAVRALGFAARFVSGYVYNPSRQEGMVGGGNTHAWVRIFLPGSGWVEFDPTNGIIGNRGLIRVAIARDPYQALPLSGTWFGLPASFLGMDVSVDITLADPVLLPRSGEGATNSRVHGSIEKGQPC